MRPTGFQCVEETARALLVRLATARRRACALAFAIAAALPAAPASAFTYCAHNAGELQSALTDAGGGGTHDGQANTIHVASGTYTTSGAAFTFGTLSGAALTIDGGYNSACTVEDATPGATSLDGGNSTQVLSLGTNGDLTLRHMTIEHGSYGGAAGGGASIALNGLNASAVATFDSIVVRDNADSYGGGSLTIFGNGTVYLQNSLFNGNSGRSVAGFSVSLTVGTAYITNNTITDNTNTEAAHAITTIGSATATAYVSNTISYGNHGTGIDDYYLYGFANTTFVHDDYTSISGTVAAGSGNNFVGIDPRFVGGGDFRLRDTSPLLGVGTLSPPGGLPGKDIEDKPRTLNGTVDLGAYENVDVIFASDFEPL